MIIVVIVILLSRLILFCAYCYVMTSSVSTLVDLWNTEWMNEYEYEVR
jgi:hypothetical protein